MIVQDLLVVLAGAGLDRSTGNLPVLQPACRVDAKRDGFLGVVVGGVPLVFVDLRRTATANASASMRAAKVRGALWNWPSGPV
jgi:hypothetical protein